MPATVTLPNYKTLFINKDGKVFYLTPFEKIDSKTYAKNQLSEYQKAVIEGDVKVHYSEDGKTFNGMKNSVVEPLVTESDDISINLWLKACYFVVLKSTSSSRCWFLHYDPLQTINSKNEYNEILYTRPNYCDLNPGIPYDLTEATLGEDEQVDVLVISTQSDYDSKSQTNMIEGNFDEEILRKRLGKRINSIQYESVRRVDEKLKARDFPIFDVEFHHKTSHMKVTRRNDNCVILNKSNCFPDHAVVKHEYEAKAPLHKIARILTATANTELANDSPLKKSSQKAAPPLESMDSLTPLLPNKDKTLENCCACFIAHRKS